MAACVSNVHIIVLKVVPTISFMTVLVTVVVWTRSDHSFCKPKSQRC